MKTNLSDTPVVVTGSLDSACMEGRGITTYSEVNEWPRTVSVWNAAVHYAQTLRHAKIQNLSIPSKRVHLLNIRISFPERTNLTTACSDLCP